MSLRAREKFFDSNVNAKSQTNDSLKTENEYNNVLLVVRFNWGVQAMVN